MTGKGDLITVPLAAGLADSLVYNSYDVADIPARYLTIRDREIVEHAARGGGEKLSYNYEQIKEMLDPFYCTYVCQDGRPFYVVAPCHLIHQQRCLEVLGIWDEVSCIPTGDVFAQSKDWGDGVHCLLGTYPLTDPTWIKRLKSLMRQAFKKHTAQEWQTMFGENGVPGAATLTSAEWLRSDHALASGLVQQRPGTGAGTDKPAVFEAGPVVWHKNSVVPSTVAQREQGKTVGRGAGAGAGAGAGWLAGVNVLDLSNVIAGPVAGGMLARFGATVVKVDPAKPIYDPLVAVSMGVPPNRGKKSLLANIKTEEGREVLRRGVQWADVVVTNQTDAQLHSLGVDDVSLKAINPNIILTHFDAYGGPSVGPRSNHIGYDDLLQASTGIMSRFGGGLDTPEEHAHLGTIDVVSGFATALAAVMSLFKLRRTGEAGIARSSLASNAQLIQTPFMITDDGSGNASVPEPSGPHALGTAPLYRWYHTADGGSCFVAAPHGTARRASAATAVWEALGLSGASRSPSSSSSLYETEVEKAIGALSMADTVDILANTGVTVQPLRSMAELRINNPSTLQAIGGSSHVGMDSSFHFIKETDHPIGTTVSMLAPWSLRSNTYEIPLPDPAPKYGSHTQQVLSKHFNFTEGEIDAMVESGAVATQWSDQYLPDGNPWAGTEFEYEEFMSEMKSTETAAR